MVKKKNNLWGILGIVALVFILFYIGNFQNLSIANAGQGFDGLWELTSEGNDFYSFDLTGKYEIYDSTKGTEGTEPEYNFSIKTISYWNPADAVTEERRFPEDMQRIAYTDFFLVFDGKGYDRAVGRSGSEGRLEVPIDYRNLVARCETDGEQFRSSFDRPSNIFNCDISGTVYSPNGEPFVFFTPETINMRIKFPKLGVECLNNLYCSEDSECIQNQCVVQSKSFYRLENNQCSLVVIPETQKLENDYLTQAECVLNIVEEPDKPQPSKNIFERINDWITNFFKRLLGLSISGSETVEPNTIETYKIDISTDLPDKDFSDGTYQVQYGSWALVDKDGNILQQGQFEEIEGRYAKNVTITTPSNIGDFALVGLIDQFDMTYDFENKVWNSEENIVNKEAIDLRTKYNIVAPENPNPSPLQDLLNRIRNFFCNNFRLFCS